MARFYFDTRNGGVVRDDTGSEFPTLQAARDAAVSLLPDIAREELPDGDERVFSVTVRDEHDRSLFHAMLRLSCSKLT